MIKAKKVSLIPKGIEPVKAAALPTAGITSITALLDVGKFKYMIIGKYPSVNWENLI